MSLADIEKLFPQINLTPKPHDYIHFLWLKCINIMHEDFDNNKLVEYHVYHVVFGLTPSPSLFNHYFDNP